MRNQKGFTLIETTIAMFIMGITLLAGTALQINSVKGNTTGNMMTVANNMAREKMEECAMKAWNLEDGNYNDQSGPYNRTWIVQPHTDRSKKVTVYVAFVPGIGSPKRVELISYVGMSHQQLNDGKIQE